MIVGPRVNPSRMRKVERPIKEVVQEEVEDLEEGVDHHEEGDHIILLQ